MTYGDLVKTSINGCVHHVSPNTTSDQSISCYNLKYHKATRNERTSMI